MSPLVVRLSFLVLAGCGGGGAAGGTIPPTVDDTTLGAGDVFDVRVYGEEELSGTYRVAQDGSIDFPFVGRIEVAGQEPPLVANQISLQLRDGGYLVNPQVSVFVQEYNSKRVSVVGAVAEPGTFPLEPNMTVVRAISQAGGFTPLASRDSVVVTRRINGELRRFRVEVEEITEGSRDDVPVQAGDIIYVPERLF